MSAKKFSTSKYGIQGTAQTVRLSCEPIILLIRHFEGPTEVHLNNW